MITKEKFLSFPLNKRYFMAASDLARAENLLRDGLTDLAEDSIKTAYGFIGYLFEDDPALRNKLPSVETCISYLRGNESSRIRDVYLALMELGGAPIRPKAGR